VIVFAIAAAWDFLHNFRQTGVVPRQRSTKFMMAVWAFLALTIGLGSLPHLGDNPVARFVGVGSTLVGVSLLVLLGVAFHQRQNREAPPPR